MKFPVIFDSESADHYFFGRNIIQLKLLKSKSIQFLEIFRISPNFISQPILSIYRRKDQIRKIRPSIAILLILIRIRQFMNSDICGIEISWLQSTVRNHIKNVYHVMRETRTVKKSTFSSIIHSVFSTTHLNHTVIDGFVGVFKGLVKTSHY